MRSLIHSLFSLRVDYLAFFYAVFKEHVSTCERKVHHIKVIHHITPVKLLQLVCFSIPSKPNNVSVFCQMRPT